MLRTRTYIVNRKYRQELILLAAKVPNVEQQGSTQEERVNEIVAVVMHGNNYWISEGPKKRGRKEAPTYFFYL